MTSPNPEQRPAISHRGGVLLKAGAGSGKTYVLVEHMIHLLREWRREWEEGDKRHSFSEELAEKFSSSVLMTFTKLAAGEISVRLTTRFQQEAASAPEAELAWWTEALAQLDRLTVTTIDGFFYKLVRRGYFPHLPPDVGIIMEGPRQKRLAGLFDEWWSSREAKLPEGVRRDVAMYREALISTLLDIFNNPALRDAWVSFDPEEARPARLGWLAAELHTLERWGAFLDLEPVAVPDEARQANNKWVPFADALAQRKRSASTWEEILDWAEFCDSPISKTVLNFGKSKPLVQHYFDPWKDFRDSVKKWASAFRAYEASFETKILPWYRVLVDLVRHMEKGLSPADGLTYGDLEFHVLREMRRPSVAARVRKDFHYFVVDEFQDTSRVQFEVLQLLCDGDYKKLFCVGDAKQAIYGFRGGELGVFRDLEKESSVRTLLLAQNYRSLPEVVSFNNAFFHRLFPLGPAWEGSDPHAVAMEPQLSLAKDGMSGAVKVLEVELPDICAVDPTEQEKKKPAWRTSQLHKAEATIFADYIAGRLGTLGSGRIAVLYKKLAPTGDLMSALIKRNVGFTAQAKIPFGDDPVAGMLLALLEDGMGAKGGSWAAFMVNGYLDLLRLKPAEPNIPQAISLFHTDAEVYGLKTAFDLFMSRLGISNSLYQSNHTELNQILDLAEGDREKAWLRLSAASDERWSADFRFGHEPHRVVLQTSHGSKGLEYEVVLVGGLATNGRSMNQRDWIGSLPGAALWVDDPSLRRKEPTPQLLYEKALLKQKEFAESKRLFYVACTRAKEELVFIRFSGLDGQLASDALSWGQGLSVALEDAELPVERQRVALQDLEIGGVSVPFFHVNTLGLSRKENFHARTGHGVTSELSVTRLGALLECPRKFYLKNILKLPEPTEVSPTPWDIDAQGEEAPRPMSSSERGSAIHLGLSHAIGHNLVLPLEWLNNPARPNMEWALEQLRPYRSSGAGLISEVPLKFPLFGFMVTGIPDLLVLPKDSAEVWDFKTGRRNESSELKYWQQLENYAWAMWVSGRVDRKSPVSMRLCYVDGQEMVSREATYDQVKLSLFSVWSRLSNLHATNLEHCPVCPYKDICPR